MPNHLERLKQFDDQKLIDIVKNYRQYGYEDALRNAALEILETRGIDMEMLKLTGNLENQTFNTANNLFTSFNRNSTIAFSLYGTWLCFRGLIFLFLKDNKTIDINFIAVFFLWGILISYIVFFVKAYLDQREFYKVIKKPDEAEIWIVYFLLGMPLYIFMYFYFKNQMKEQMHLIR